MRDCLDQVGLWAQVGFSFPFVCFRDRVSLVALAVLDCLCKPGWPKTHPEPPASAHLGAGIKGLRHHNQLVGIFLTVF